VKEKKKNNNISPQLGAEQARTRIVKIKPGIYQNTKDNSLLIIGENNKYNIGHIVIRKDKYKYARWRDGEKIRETYMGKVKKDLLKVTLKKKGYEL